MTAVLDTNVLLRHLVDDDPEQSPRATRYMSRVRDGELRVVVPVTVFFEANYILRSTFGLTRLEVVDILQPLVSWRGLDISDRRGLTRAFQLYGEHNVSLADAYHAALAEREEPPQLLTF